MREELILQNRAALRTELSGPLSVPIHPLIQPSEEIRSGQRKKAGSGEKVLCDGGLDSVAVLPLWGDLGSGGCDKVGSGLVEQAFFFLWMKQVFLVSESDLVSGTRVLVSEAGFGERSSRLPQWTCLLACLSSVHFWKADVLRPVE